jgi:hypothetical protein
MLRRPIAVRLGRARRLAAGPLGDVALHTGINDSAINGQC